MKKRILSMFLMLCMLSTVLVVFPVNAFAADNGTCGDNLTWTLDENGILTISGTGAMTDYYSNAPWDSWYITAVNISEGVTSIGSCAFYDCERLTSITIPDSVISIGEYAFGDCTGLTSVAIGNGVEEIGEYAFGYCKRLTSITIPDSVISIGDLAFLECTGLTSVTIGNSVEEIGYEAFSGCESLTSIAIPDSVTGIGEGVFAGCSSLTGITVDENNANYCSDDGNLYTKDKTCLIQYALGKTATEWKIPDTVTQIGAVALGSSAYLTKVTIPDSVITIDGLAFAYGLWEEISIPASVTHIGNAVCCGCENLTEINVDGNNTSYCSVDGVLFDKDKTELLQYPAGKTNTSYKIPDGVKTISYRSFNECFCIENLMLPSSLEVVESRAFADCFIEYVLYQGTEEEYENIEIESGNDDLIYATIICGYDGMPASIKSVDCSYNNNKVTANIEFNYITQAGKLLLAIYDNGKLVNLKDKSVTPDDISDTIEIAADDSYKDYDVKVFLWKSLSSLKPIASAVETEITESVYTDTVLESEHPYAADTDETKTYIYEGECVSINVTFSDDTETEEECDYIYIYDADDNAIGKYSGTELAGKTINVPGNTVKIRLVSDSIYNEYGYKTESIAVNK